MALQRLNKALESLSHSVEDFNIGAVSIGDYKPLEEQVNDLRKILRVQKAHFLLLSGKHNQRSVAEKPQDDIGTTVERIHEDVANLKYVKRAITLCLQSSASDSILCKSASTPEVKKQLQTRLRKLYTLNDDLIALFCSITEARMTELELQKSFLKLSLEYRAFLKDQEALRDKRLEETNPQLLRNKEKLEKKLTKINVMKRLSTNMIATAGNVAIEKPQLFKLMKKHRDLVNIEKIIEKAREKEQPAPSD